MVSALFLGAVAGVYFNCPLPPDASSLFFLVAAWKKKIAGL